jgi:transcriptional regulator of heat shock response
MMDNLNKRIKAAQTERIEKLREAIGFEVFSSSKEFSAEFSEKIYYKGYAYLFNDNGFVEKQELAQGEFTETSEDTMIRIVETNETRTSEEIIIQSEEV